MRGARKYPLGSYEWNSSNHSFLFYCDNVHGIDCDYNADISPVLLSDLEINCKYFLFERKNSYIYGLYISVCEIDTENMYVKFNIINKFGKESWLKSEVNDDYYCWLNQVSPRCWRIVFLSSKRRWKAFPDFPTFELVKSQLEYPHEVKCCQPFFDTHTTSIDHDDTDEIICMGSLIRVRNIHSLLGSLKVLHCVKCKKTLPGIEDIHQLDLVEDHSFGQSLKSLYLNSEVLNAASMFLDKKFENTFVIHQMNQLFLVFVVNVHPILLSILLQRKSILLL